MDYVHPQRALLSHVHRRHKLIEVLQLTRVDVSAAKVCISHLLVSCEEDLRAVKFFQPFFFKRLAHPDLFNVNERSELVTRTKRLVKELREWSADKNRCPELDSRANLKKAIIVNENNNEGYLNCILLDRLVRTIRARVIMVEALGVESDECSFKETLSEEDQVAIGDYVQRVFQGVCMLESCGRMMIDYLLDQDQGELVGLDYLVDEFDNINFALAKMGFAKLSNELPFAKRLEVSVRQMRDTESDFGSRESSLSSPGSMSLV